MVATGEEEKQDLKNLVETYWKMKYQCFHQTKDATWKNGPNLMIGFIS
jgi:hypothetical protein